MRRHKRALVLGLAASLGVSVLLVSHWLRWRWIPRPEAFAQIKVGMTQAEVEALVGCAPGFYTRYPLAISRIGCVYIPDRPSSIRQTWMDDQHLFYVWFDSNNRAVGVAQWPGYERYPPQSLQEWYLWYRCLRSQLGF
jgi:hypothetical protein